MKLRRRLPFRLHQGRPAVERLIAIESGTGVKLGDQRNRCNDACPAPGGLGYQAQSMLAGHGGEYTVTRIVPYPKTEMRDAVAVYGVRVGPQIVRDERLPGLRRRDEHFLGIRLAEDDVKPRALGSEFRLHHYHRDYDGRYRVSRLVHYSDGSTEEFGVRLGVAA